MLRVFVIALFGLLLLTRTYAAEPPATGPETEKRFPPLKVPAGFKVTLFACDPLLEYPSAIALGPRANTLFVAADYMTGLGTTDIIRRDEIRLVEDTDGNGYADRAPVWADGFNSIQGLTYHDGTVFVMHAPYLTELRDTDGDGVADERKNLFKGLGLGPEDDKVRLHNANGIVAGYDGWLYLALGDRGCDVTRPEGDLLVHNGGGILRCRLDGRDLHVFSTGLRNIYDVALDEDLNVFTRDNENDGGNYKIRVIRSFFGADHGYPYLYEERPDEALAPLADLGLGSSAGGEYYKETQFPPEYRNLYFCEWGRAVMRSVPESPGKPFSPMKEIDFASGAENDPYGFKPTDLIVDRDGSLLIADWADGQRPKRGRARIYRVQSVARTPTSERSAGGGQATQRLNSDSYHERLAAQLQFERQARANPAAVIDLLKKANLNDRGWMHGVWILAHVLGTQASDELFNLAQNSNSPRVQIQAIRALADLHDPILTDHRLDAGPSDKRVAERIVSLVDRQHPHRTLEVVTALGQLKWAKAPDWLVQNLTSMDAIVAHAAQQSLRRCGDWFAVLRLLDGPSKIPPEANSQQIALRDVALRALADQADKRIVDWLDVRIQTADDPRHRREYADLLSRVHRKPAPWVYWGFRPAPRPANTVDWKRTEFIEQTLDRLLSDQDREVRVAVLQRMQRETIPTKLETLAAWLREDTEPAGKALILEALREHPAETRRETLHSFVSDVRQPATVRTAAFALWREELGDDWESRLLTLAAPLDNDPVLADVLREFGRRGETSQRPRSSATQTSEWLLAQSTISKSAAVRAAAFDTLARLKIAGGAGAVVKGVLDKDADVRAAAAFAVGRLEVRDAIPLLIRLARTESEPPEVRRASLEALRLLREPRVAPLAAAALSDGTTQLTAMRCLAEFGEPEHAAAVIEAATRNSNLEVVSLAVESLTKWSARDGIEPARRSELGSAVSELQGLSGTLLRWTIVGPFADGDVTKSVESFSNANQTPVGRTVVGSGTDARLRENVAAGHWLAITDFSSLGPTAAQFLISSNTPVKVWLNGKPVFERSESRRYQPDADRFDAALLKGSNRLLMQLRSVSDGAIEFHARFRQKSSKAEHERLVEAALTRPGNVERGRKMFLTIEKSQCLKCHRLNDQGEKIGPELTGIGSRFSRIHIVESLLDPSRTIAAGFQSQTVALQDGRVLSGLKIAETADTLTLADNQGKKHSLRKADIEESKAHAGSIMPDGLEKTLTVDEFVDLIAFLTGEKQAASR